MSGTICRLSSRPSKSDATATEDRKQRPCIVPDGTCFSLSMNAVRPRVESFCNLLRNDYTHRKANCARALTGALAKNRRFHLSQGGQAGPSSFRRPHSLDLRFCHSGCDDMPNHNAKTKSTEIAQLNRIRSYLLIWRFYTATTTTTTIIYSYNTLL
jgi:hypothetical protein